MKRLLIFMISILVIYTVYFDLTKGTLPLKTETITEASKKEPSSPTQLQNEPINYFEKEVKRGETVLSIMEQQLNSSIPVSIEKVIHDFELLNDGIKPEEIQYGKRYKFPYYEQSSNE